MIRIFKYDIYYFTCARTPSNMSSWSDFLTSPRNAGDVFKLCAFLRDFCQMPDGSYDAAEASEIVNMLAERLVETWLGSQSANNQLEPDCDLAMPFYKSISRAAVLVALGPNSGITPISIGMDNLLNNTGFLERREAEN